jgi:NADH-quinone oxidoreductase subunit H
MFMLDALYNFIVFPGFVFTLALGSLSSWIDRKVTARVQWRVGPPWYQPFADILKLLGKETIMPEGANEFLFIASPMIGFAGAILVSTMLWRLNLSVGSTFIGDLIVVLYLLLLPSLAIMLGGFASGNPFAVIGASREMKLILAYELPFVIAMFTVVAKVGSILIGNILLYQADGGMLIYSPSCLIAFIVALLSVQAKLGMAPFDIAEAEQEIASGPFVDYSGPLLALFKMSKMMLLAVFPVFLITVFFGGAKLGSASGIFSFALKYVMILVLIVLIKNTNPRLRIDHAVKVFWGPVLALSIAGFILSVFGA